MRTKYFFIWSRLPAYAQRGLIELQKNCEIYFCSQGEPPPHNYLSNNVDSLSLKLSDFGRVVYNLLKHRPEFVFLPGWQYKRYLILALILKPLPVNVVLMADTIQFIRTNSFITRAAISFLNLFTNSMFVPGERGDEFFRSIGYRRRIIKGLYSADTAIYHSKSHTNLNQKPKELRLLFIGRVEPEKGIVKFVDWLLKNPSMEHVNLTIVGNGSQLPRVSASPRVNCLGWLEAEDIVEVMRVSDYLILPSTYEPWGVVVHEALSTGLAVVCSQNVGSAIDFEYTNMVHTFYNFEDIETLLLPKEVPCYNSVKWNTEEWAKNVQINF